MITALSKAISNPVLVNIAQNTDASVACKTAVNAVGRPGFIIIDNNISSDTKKFAATKEFLYQATCLAVYMALIVPIFKKYGFQIAKNKIFKNTNGFEHFKNLKEYDTYKKLASNVNVTERLKSLEKSKNMFSEELITELKKEKPNTFSDIKGSIDLSNIVGSVIGLSIIAPQVSQALIKPVLKFIGMDKKEPPKENLDKQA